MSDVRWVPLDEPSVLTWDDPLVLPFEFPELSQLWLGVLDPVPRLELDFMAELVDIWLESVVVIPALDEEWTDEPPAIEWNRSDEESGSVEVWSLELSAWNSLDKALPLEEVKSEVQPPSEV